MENEAPTPFSIPNYDAKPIESKKYILKYEENIYSLTMEIYYENNIYFKLRKYNNLSLYHHMNKYNYEEITKLFLLHKEHYTNISKVFHFFDLALTKNKIKLEYNKENNKMILKLNKIIDFDEIECRLELNESKIQKDEMFNLLIDEINEIKNNKIDNNNNNSNLINELTKKNLDYEIRIKNLEDKINILDNELKNYKQLMKEILNYNKKNTMINLKEKEKDNSKEKEFTLNNKNKCLNSLIEPLKFDTFSSFLTEQEIYSIGKTSKKFRKFCLEKLKEINTKKLSKEQKELESINTGYEKLLTELTLGKVSKKCIENLNEKDHTEYFQNEKAPDEAILLTYRILYQLINKEKNILKENNKEKFWRSFRESMLKNSEKGIGNFIQNEFKNLDFSKENIYRLNCLTEGQEERLGSINIGWKDKTAKFISYLIKEALEYIKIFFGKRKKFPNSEVYKKYLEYIIKKREENKKKLENLLSKA